MSLPNEMVPFSLPAGFGEDDDTQPAIDFIGVDPREHALDCLADFADMLYGDMVLVPFADGEPDWANTNRDTLTKLACHWSEVEPADIARLAVLTDGFNRFIENAEDVSVVTLWRGGTPDVRQIDGVPCPAAQYLITEALIDYEPLKVRQVKPEELPKPANDNQPSKLIKASRFVLRDPAQIPERDWLFAKHYVRRYLTSTVGAGGGGKSAHAISEALAMVTGRPLLEPDGPLGKKLRIWYINVEDPRDEIERRFAGAAKHFGISNEQIGGRLFTDSGRESEFVIMRQVGREFKVCEPFVGAMVAEIKANQIDVVIVDPFVSTHEVPENDNSAIQRVAKAWLQVAELGDCCVEVIHHVVKGAEEITADSGRGGGALKDKARSVRTINGMSHAEATKAGVDDRREHFRVDLGKVNMTKSEGSQWRRFESVSLGNGGSLGQGDSIGVVVPWRWPTGAALADRAAKERATLVGDIPIETLTGLKVRLENGDYKANDQAATWAGNVVAEVLGIELEDKTERKRVKAMLEAWIDAGELEIVRIHDAHRRITPHIKPVCGTT